jgi:integrase
MGHIKRRKRKDGSVHKNYTAYWTGVDGARNRKSTFTDDAEAARNRLREYERDDSVWRPPAFTVAQACGYAGKIQRDKENTERWRQRCAAVVIQHLFPLLGKDTDLNATNIPKLVSDYIEKRRAQKGPEGKPISKSTIKKELLIVRQGCEQGQIYEEFFGNLKLFVPRHLSKKGPQRGVRLTLDQANKLIEVATPHRRPWLVFGVHSGVDIGALARIKKSDVDFTKGRHGVVFIPDTKNEHRPRTIPLTRESRWAVDARMREADGELLFAPTWSSQQFRVCMDRWCPRAGIPDRLRWKDLRRTAASLAGERGASELVLGKFFGWSGSSEMLKKVYLHLDDSAFHEMVETLPALRVPEMCQAAPDPDRKSQRNLGNAEIGQVTNPLGKAG